MEVTAASVSRADEWGCLPSASVWWLLRCGWHVFLNEQMSPLFALLQRRRLQRTGGRDAGGKRVVVAEVGRRGGQGSGWASGVG